MTRLFAPLLAFFLLVAACSPTEELTDPSPDAASADQGAGGSAAGDASGADGEDVFDGNYTYAGEQSAPEFPPALDWLNVSWSWRELRSGL